MEPPPAGAIEQLGAVALAIGRGTSGFDAEVLDTAVRIVNVLAAAGKLDLLGPRPS